MWQQLFPIWLASMIHPKVVSQCPTEKEAWIKQLPCYCKETNTANIFCFYGSKQQDVDEILRNVTQMQNIKEIIISCSNSHFIIELKPDIIQRMKDLASLSILDCHLRSVPLEIRKLKKLKHLKISTFQAYRPLKFFARITKIRKENFSDMENLRHLDLSNNFLTFIDNDAFRLLPILEELILGPGNDLDENVFEALKNISTLKTLKLESLKLSRFPEGALNLPNLEHVYIGGNSFTSIFATSFTGLPALRTLDLSGCRKLSWLHSSAFVGLNNLETLNLSKTDLYHYGAFLKPLRNLKVLDLSNTKIKSVPVDAFKHTPNLDEIYLGNAYIKSLSPSVFEKLDKLQIIDISRNLWQCDNELRKLVKFLNSIRNRIHLQNSNDTVCIWPYGLDGKNIMELDDIIPSYFVELDTYSNKTVDAENDDIDELTLLNSSNIYKPEAAIQFKIKNITELVDERISSMPVVVNGLSWRIMVMLRTEWSRRTVLFRLLCDGPSKSTNWSSFTEAIIKVFAQKHGIGDRSWKFSNTFHNNQNGTSFSISLYELDEYFTQDGTVTLEVYLYVNEPQFGMQYAGNHGYVGLVNQRSTCYLNTVVQILFHMKKIRKVIYGTATQKPKSVLRALQTVFYNLEFSGKPASTRKLTESFRLLNLPVWESSFSDVSIQQDVLEFFIFLLDKMGKEMNGTSVENLFRQLFKIHIKSHYVAKHVEFLNERDKNFNILPLSTYFSDNIYKSLKQFLEGEEIVYWTGKQGKQPVEITYQFDNFPPVLIVQLKRFYWDEQLRKDSDRFVFYERLDLNNYLKKPNQTNPADYLLFAVIAHSGSTSSGHNVVFINPEVDGNWYKFDDDDVSQVDIREVIQANFGNKAYPRNMNAYMLVYIQESQLNNVLSPITKSDIPTSLRNFFETTE